MKGSIYSDQKCLCGKGLRYVEGEGYLTCPAHSDVRWDKDCRVRFGRPHNVRFKTVKEAEEHLTYLRAQDTRGVYDHRDWIKKAPPLAFGTLRRKFVLSKKKDAITAKQIRHITHVLETAGKNWDNLNIKDISEGEIEDFFDEDHGISNKTLANWKTVLHDFWKWVVRRERRTSRLEMPEFPDIKYKMEKRMVVSMEDQAAIIEEVRRISWDENPRIWLGIWLMSWYPKVRPGEMRDMLEGHVFLSDKWIVFPDPKEGEPKYIHLLPEHIDIIKEIRDMVPAAMPDMPFFRHLKTKSGVKAGTQFGPKYFNQWWLKACKNIGIEGVPLYPGVRHSTVTALGKVLSPEQIQHNITGHVSDAFRRYFLPDAESAVMATRKIKNIRKEKTGQIAQFKRKSE